MLLSKGAELVTSVLEGAGYEAYVVGGSVRDILMSKTPSDFDVTTNALPEETKSLFEKYTTFTSGITHGTVAVVIDGEIIEITTFRSDGDYLDHRRPDSVSFTSRLEEDLSRRDFTINAMAYSHKSGVVDVFGGMTDIEGRVIRCVGESERRFEEDALRILRALRFSSVLDFDIHFETSRAIHQKASLLSFVSRERVSTELRKLLSGHRVARIIEEYSDVFDVLFEINLDDIGKAIENTLDNVVKLALFFYNAPQEIDKIVPSKKEKQLLLSSIELSKKQLPTDEPKMAKLLVNFGEALFKAIEIKRALGEDTDKLCEVYKSAEKTPCINIGSLKIGGKDLIALGVPPSHKIGEILELLFDMVLEKKIKNEREELLRQAKLIIQK